MPVWAVQIASGEDETVEAGLLTTEGGALVAFSQEGLLLRAWAAGRWESVTCLVGMEECAPNQVIETEPVVFGLPSR